MEGSTVKMGHLIQPRNDVCIGSTDSKLVGRTGIKLVVLAALAANWQHWQLAHLFELRLEEQPSSSLFKLQFSLGSQRTSLWVHLQQRNI